MILNYIDGELIPALSDSVMDVFDPSTGETYTTAPDSDKDDVLLAIASAKKAFPAWAALGGEARSVFLAKIADVLEANLEEFALAETKDNGKPLRLSKTVDIPRASANFRFFAQAITQFSTEAHENVGHSAINYTLRQPLGVVGCISPWNLPLYLFSWKIAPALAAGNTVVAKPSEVTPMTAFLLSKICQEVGLPKGVLNILHGYGPNIGPTLTAHPSVKAISFTGSTRVGKEIATIAAPLFKKVSLEMGGKNPNIIFADCDYDKMLQTTVHSSFSNQGQICLCGSRILVERSIYARFKADFVKKAAEMRVGHPLDNGTQIGAIVSEVHFQKIQSCVALAIEEGGTVLCGGKTVQLPEYPNGWYMQPTVIEGLGPSCRTNQEEIFGPVVTIAPFDTEEEALQVANSTDYGLSCTIWTENLSRAHRFSAQVEAGIVWVNTWLLRDLRTPFGGVKNSGVGREGGWEALRFFTEAKNVCIRY